MLRVFEILWRRSLDRGGVEFPAGEDPESLLEKGKALLRVFEREARNDANRVLGVEEPFELRIPGLDLPVVGVFDLVEEDAGGSLVVVDYKTSSKAWSRREADASLQATVYGMAAGRGRPRVKLRLDVLVKTKEPKFLRYPTERTEADERFAARSLVEIRRAVALGVFVPRPSWKCGSCPCAELCEEWGGERGEGHESQRPTA